jgi:diphthine methyl ester acylhydrolase
MLKVELVKSLILDLPPCCIELWPFDPQYAVVGTYNLENKASEEDNYDTTDEQNSSGKTLSQERNGSLILLHVDDDDV